MTEGSIVGSFIVPVHPHTVLVPEQNEGWQRLRDAFDEAAQRIKDAEAVSYTHLTLPTKA